MFVDVSAQPPLFHAFDIYVNTVFISSCSWAIFEQGFWKQRFRTKVLLLDCSCFGTSRSRFRISFLLSILRSALRMRTRPNVFKNCKPFLFQLMLPEGTQILQDQCL